MDDLFSKKEVEWMKEILRKKEGIFNFTELNFLIKML